MTPALELARAALAAADGLDAEALAHAESSGLARFAESEVHQPTLIDDLVVTLRVVREGRVGRASTNRVGDDGLTDLAARAVAAAAGASPDPDFPGFAEPAALPPVEAFDEATAALGPEDQARLAGEAIAAADLPVYGFFTSGTAELAIASSTGLEAEQRLTDACVLVLAADEQRSGYAEATAWRVGDVDPATVAREAAAKAAMTQGATELRAGEYAAVLESYALAELLQNFSYDSLGALGLLEERGYFAGRIGEKVFDEKVSIADDALDPRGLPKAFDFEGSPKQRVDLVSEGVARGVVWDRATASRADGASTTGHAPLPDESDLGPLPYAITMTGGEAATVGELIERVGDGLYITRLHYLSVVSPRDGVITGMTRDGTFRIRNGKLAEPLVNLRFTVSVPELLGDIYALTQAQPLVNGSSFYGGRYPYGARVPALAAARFTISGTGSTPGI